MTRPETERRQPSGPHVAKLKMFGPYYLLRTIGEGEFGKVKLAVHSQSSKEVAIKLVNKASLDTEMKRTKLMREISILQSLDHPFIVRLLDVLETERSIGLVMEYASGGELFEHILTLRYLKEKEACRFFVQLISGVQYLHSHSIVHRDLKLASILSSLFNMQENLLLDGDRNVIITDFGFANSCGSTEPDKETLLTTSCGSPCYAAPELVISEGYVGEAADIWSCGVILYAMVCGYLPFDDDPKNPAGESINLLYKYILETKLEFPVHVSQSVCSLLRRMLVPDPKYRAKMSEIMAHPWLEPYAHILKESLIYTKSTLPEIKSDETEQAVPHAPMATPEISSDTVEMIQSSAVPSVVDAVDTLEMKLITPETSLENIQQHGGSGDVVPVAVVTDLLVPSTEDNEQAYDDMAAKQDEQVVEDHMDDQVKVQISQDKMSTNLQSESPKQQIIFTQESNMMESVEHELVEVPSLPKDDLVLPEEVVAESTHVEMVPSENIQLEDSNGYHPMVDENVELSSLPAQAVPMDTIESQPKSPEMDSRIPPSLLQQQPPNLVSWNAPRQSFSEERASHRAITKIMEEEHVRKSFDLTTVSTTMIKERNEKINWYSRKREEIHMQRVVEDSQPRMATISSRESMPSDAEEPARLQLDENQWYPGRKSTVPAPSNYEFLKPLKLRYHSGPIDKNALSNRCPTELIQDIQMVLKNAGLYVRPSSSESTSFKLKVVRPRGQGYEANVQPQQDYTREPNAMRRNVGMRRNKAPEDNIYSSHPSSGSRFARVISSLPMSLIRRVKYMAKHGTSWNKGFDGKREEVTRFEVEEPLPHDPSTQTQNQEEDLKFYIEIQKIRNLKGLYVVDFKRRQGDIWLFKRLYQDLLPKFPLGETDI